MKQLFKLLLAVLLASAISVDTTAQRIRPNIVAFSWEVSIPSAGDYLKETSFSGWRFDYRRMLKPNLSAGIAVSWNAFDEYFGYRTYKNAETGAAVSTDVVRQIYTVPITLTTHYYPEVKTKLVQPYAGIGIGAQYMAHNHYFNIYEITEENWGFVVRPEIGALFRMGGGGVIGLFSFGYNIATNDSDAFNQNGFNQFSFNLGIGFAQ